jgi:hypothetical protein
MMKKSRYPFQRFPTAIAVVIGIVCLFGLSPALRAEAAETLEHSAIYHFDITDEQAVRASIPSTMDAAALDGAQRGTLTLETLDLQPCYGSLIRSVDRAVVYEDLPDNDVARIPQTHTFDVTVAEGGQDVNTSASLELSDITYEVAAQDEMGLPSSYRARCCYRGTASGVVLTGYEATVHYVGLVEAVAPTLLPTVPTETIDRAELAAQEESVTASLPIAQGIGVAAASAGSLLILFWYRRRKKVRADDSVGRETPAQPSGGAYVPLAVRHQDL